jgi:hypothetical protein
VWRGSLGARPENIGTGAIMSDYTNELKKKQRSINMHNGTPDIQSQVRARLARERVTFTVTGGHLTTITCHEDKPWQCFAWIATFCRDGMSEQFEYYTGTGLVTRPKTNLIAARPTVPHAADVLNALISDGTAAHQSFGDWCGDSGCDEDSIKAFDVYRACCRNAIKLERVLTRDSLKELQTILEDY